MTKKIIILFISLTLHLSAFESSINYYSGQGIKESLPDTLYNIINYGVDLESTYIDSISYTASFYEFNKHIYLGYEFDVAKYTGVQNNFEIGALPLIFFDGVMPENDFIDVDLVWGMGLSYAIGRPEFEQGPNDDPDRRYALLVFILFDLDIYLPDYPEWRFFLRKHHRSGAYGVVAPEHVGSNFVGYGIKYVY